jgi:hypothetical protein
LPCLGKFQEIRDYYGIAEHILFLEVSSAEIDGQLLAKFAKIYPNLVNSSKPALNQSTA